MKKVPPEVLSKQLREGRSASLSRRRFIVGGSLFCCGTMALAALYQTGVIGRAPDGSFPHFDSNKVMWSPQAYEIPGMIALGASEALAS